MALHMDDGILGQMLNCALGLAYLQILNSSNEYCVGAVQGVRVCRVRRPLSNYKAQCFDMPSIDPPPATPRRESRAQRQPANASRPKGLVFRLFVTDR